MSVLGPILIDGEEVAAADASLSVLDIGLQRGYGCFESVRSYGGKPFRLAPHLDRLEVSAAALRMPLPPRADLERWARHRAAEGDCSVRIMCTGGIDQNRPGVDSRCIVIATSLPEVPPTLRLQSRTAPWHPDGEWSELTGAKTLSYAPNLAARLASIADGFDDALLIGPSGAVLEGPTYSIGWIRGTTLEVPGPDLGVLAGVTSTAVCEVAPQLGLDVVPGSYRVEQLLEADEVMAMSTLRAVRPVLYVDDVKLRRGPYGDRLNRLYEELVARELAGE
ncbi:MAG TPA: aminotransferase class IV [Acidimicrobiia bacterium]|jgi:branched-subunit amino acid aminotransferase/4-amino-4-deoxychorismate lyase|nr:aminotransferase class IV [Acidimicrobiia bacterium]